MAARTKKRPTLTHCKVKLTGQHRAPWRVWHPVEGDGGKVSRAYKSFSDEELAWAWAEVKDRELANHGIRYGDIPPEARRAFDFYRDDAANLAAEGVDVPRFEDLVADALAAIRAEHQAREENAVPVAEAVAAFIDYKRTRVGERQLADLRDRLKRFAGAFGDRPAKSITTAEIESWLATLRSRRNPQKEEKPPLLGPLARNHYRANVSALFSFAAAPARAWCPRNPVADLEPERVDAGEPQAYTPEDAAKIMHTALAEIPELVPVLALGMFAGLRVSEAVAFDLGKLRHAAKEIRVTGKTGPRMAPVTPALRAWIGAQPLRKGPAWGKSPRLLVDEMQRLFTLAEVAQIANGARHSFISYRTAETRDVARVADECGNSPGTIKAHYRQLVTAAAAGKFFTIRPEGMPKKSKVTSIQLGRKMA